ncbi:MAG: SGNH/GDSL hydrolase family protein [Bacteroidetes bacterium]|nr:SGNH/GDSL hydrolase family protein [Bacteroidota bacterium]
MEKTFRLQEETGDIYIDKIKALFLNKVKGLNWYYFDIDLNDTLHEESPYSTEWSSLLDDIVLVNGAYEYQQTKTKGSDSEILKCLITFIRNYPNLLTDVVRRLFDLNEIKNNSDADEGLMGNFNEKDRERRNKIYTDKIRRGFDRSDDNKVVALAEGDSWFEFPRVYLGIDAVKDILDWLIEDDNYAVYSLAAGGDWLSNMLYLGEYIEELPKVSPDVFLLSGGGNDLVGDRRLATMVINPHLQTPTDESNVLFRRLLERRSKAAKIDMVKYKRGLSLLSDEFFQFININMVQYFAFMYSITQLREYQKMLIITHGYDFAIPTNRKRGNWVSVQRVLNNFLDTGKWLYEALNMKGITKDEDQTAVMYAVIYEFNEMLIGLANYKNFKTLYHIDCRGVADEDDWFDELHLKSGKFKLISQTYKKCIRDNFRMKNPNPSKVYRVV